MCNNIYTEPETDEHKKGKIALYEWALKQPNLTDVVLEGWIPGTRQRPDLIFWCDGKQYVIEFQCSPICSEFYERHDLYQAAGIEDIWITGSEKYNLQSETRRGFQIEKFAIASLNIESGELTFSTEHMMNCYPSTKTFFYRLPRKHLMSHCKFISGLISVESEYIEKELSDAISKQQERDDFFNTLKKNNETIFSTLEEIKDKFEFDILETHSANYIAKIKFNTGHIAFVKEKQIDFCEIDFGSMPYYSFSKKKNRPVFSGFRDRFYHRNIGSENLEKIDRKHITSAIEKFYTQIKKGD